MGSDMVEFLKRLDEIEEIVKRATPGVLSFGEIDVEIANQMATKTAPTDKVWCTYQQKEDGAWITAITGNGPTSRANAQFYAGAAPTVLSLIETLRTLCGQLEPVPTETP